MANTSLARSVERTRGPRKANEWAERGWRDAVRRAAMRKDEISGRRYLELMAETLVSMAVAGDVTALKEAGDRLDGRVNAQNTGDGSVNVSFVVALPSVMAPEAWAKHVQAKLEPPAMPHAQVSSAQWKHAHDAAPAADNVTDISEHLESKP